MGTPRMWLKCGSEGPASFPKEANPITVMTFNTLAGILLLPQPTIPNPQPYMSPYCIVLLLTNQPIGE